VGFFTEFAVNPGTYELEFILMPSTYKPGQPAPISGEFGIVGPRGGQTGQERTAIQGRTLPPTPKPGQSYVIDRPAHNGAGKRK
jgi:hypothetical protein